MRNVLLALSALTGGAAPLVAQFDFPLTRTAPGRIGQNYTLAFSGAPNNAVLLIASLTNGPTPLSLLDPADPRVLQVGLDLVALWQSGAGPSGTFTQATPNSPNLHGLTLQHQAVALPGSPFLIDKISSVAAVQLGVVDQPATLASTLVVARALASVTPLNAAVQEVVVAGGGGGSVLNPVGLDSSEIFDAQRLTSRAGPRLTTSRALAASATLSDGRTLLCGGVDALGTVLASAEIYDPVARTFTAVTPMAGPRALHSAATLPDGRVLVVGGTTNLADAVQALSNAQSSAQIFNPATGTWSNAPAMARRLLAPGLHTLSNGRVLVSGGFEVIVFLGVPVPVGSVANCQSYNPTTNSWGSAASMPNARAVHQTSTTTLPDGRLLVVAGASSGPDLTQAAAIAKADIYAPATNTWTALPDLAQARVGHTVNVLGNRAIVAGGSQGTISLPTPIADVSALSLTSLTWTTLPSLPTPRGGHASAVTNDGLLVLLGGQGPTGTLTSIETIR